MKQKSGLLAKTSRFCHRFLFLIWPVACSIKSAEHKIITMKATFLPLLLCPTLSNGAVVIFQESFETDGNGSRYTASTPFNDGSGDHWNRTDGTNITNISGAYTNVTGSFFWAAEDTDDNGGNGNDEQTLTISGIGISNYTNITVSVDFAAGNTRGPGASAYDASDYLRLNYQLSGGAKTNGVWFSYVNAGDAFNEPIAFDGNFDGNGEGALLTNTLTTYTFSVPDGTSLDLLFEVFMDSGDEEIAFDNIIVMGDLVPEPSTMLLGSFGLLALLRRRR